jgi:hypothetical protein
MAQEPEHSNRPVSYALHIKPLFSQSQRDCMLQSRKWDLFNYADVQNKAQAIYARVESGSMPDDDTAPWPDEWVALFKRWIDEGCKS